MGSKDKEARPEKDKAAREYWRIEVGQIGVSREERKGALERMELGRRERWVLENGVGGQKNRAVGSGLDHLHDWLVGVRCIVVCLNAVLSRLEILEQAPPPASAAPGKFNKRNKDSSVSAGKENGKTGEWSWEKWSLWE